MTEYFLGALTTAPLHYYLLYFLATTPLLLLLFFILSFVDVFKRPNFFKYATVFWFATHFFLQSIVPTIQQDGMRYILVILPAFALLAGVGFNHAAEIFKRQDKQLLTSFVFVLTLLTLIATSASIHPYYLDYYNEAVGGPETVQEKKLFEIGWWGEGISEATDFVSETAPEGASVIFFVGPADHLIPKLRQDIITFSAKDIEAEGETVEYNTDYIVTNNFYLWYDRNVEPEIPSEYHPVHEVKATGATLATVYQKL